MLIPSIDLQAGAVVQLVQGERLAVRDEDVFAWVRRFHKFPKVQVIDLDAATRAGDNLSLVRTIAGSLRCRVGGGIRTIARAEEVLAAGAQQVIAGSALFADGRPDVAFARALSEAIGRDRLIAAVDSRNGRVVVHGWKTELPISAVDAVPGFFIATGFSGHGFGIGPGAGRLVADMVTGAPTIVDPSPFRLSRFTDGSHPQPHPLAS